MPGESISVPAGTNHVAMPQTAWHLESRVAKFLTGRVVPGKVGGMGRFVAACLVSLATCLLVPGCSSGESSGGVADEIRSAAAFLDSMPSQDAYSLREYALRDAISRMPQKHSSAALALLNFTMAGEHLRLARQSAANGLQDLYNDNIAAIKDLSAKMQANADDLD